jgi:hypothetical protein
MHSPTLALAWQLWGRHRWGLAAVGAYCVTAAVVFNALPAGILEARHGALMSIQFVLALIYVAAVFAYGFESQLEARESCFPARLFTLPVRTGVLVGWPMLQGMAAVVLLWLAWAYFVLRPSGVEAALGSTALLAAACVAVLQALLWSPFGLPWVRVLLAVLVLPVLAVSPTLGPALGVEESVLLGLYAALIPLAALTAFAGVSRARQGEAPDWRGLFRARRTAADRSPGAPAPFPSVARAQFWFERRRHLLPFPLAAGGFAALHLAFIFRLAGTIEDVGYKAILGTNFLFFPLIFAPFFGCVLGRTGTSAGNPYRMSSFPATRPVPGTTLVAAKVKVAALGTLAAWAIVLLAASVWFVHSGSDARLLQLWDSLRQAYPTWRVTAMLLLAVVANWLIIWRLLVDNLWLGLTGRAWVVRASLVACGLGLTLVLTVYVQLIDHPDLAHRLWVELPWWAGGAVLLKLLAAGCVGRALVRRGLVGPRTLAKLLAVWLLAAVGLFILACAAVPSDVAPVSLLASGAALAVPLVRLLAAPLALAWNRHR